MSSGTPWEAGRFDTRAGPRKVLFGQMYEDVGIERAAFAPGARVFCIASAGDTAMALSLAHVVTAIDINPLQLDYARERIAGAPAVTGAAEGIMGVGRRAMALFGWRRTVLERFLALDDVDVQREYWRAHLDTLGFRLAIDALLSVSGLKAVYGSPFLAILPAHFGRVMRGRLARCFAAFSNRTNHYARALLLGEPPPPIPCERARIALVGGDAADYLERCPPASFDAFTLSNILDGANAWYRQRLFAAVRRAAAPDATVVLRSFAEPTHATPHAATARDRSILWGIVDVRPVAALDAAEGVPIPLIRPGRGAAQP
jgi:S-adenosylmethionine:diacylglycerol 3-amino-3-carboxypropyl transferase